MRIKLLRVPHFVPWEGSHRINTSYLPPLGMAQVAAYLREKNFEVDQDDLNIKLHRSQLVGYINKYKPNKNLIRKVVKNLIRLTNFNKPDVILLSSSASTFKTNRILLEELARILKKKYNPLIIIGGNRTFDISVCFHLLKEGIVDFVIKGGPSLIEKVLLFDKKKLRNLENIAFCDQDRIFFKKIELDKSSLITPDFSGLPISLYKWSPDKIFRHYLLEDINKNSNILILPINFIHGCPHKCAFCVSSSSRLKLDYINPKKVVDIIESLSKKYHTPFFMFLNDTINFSRTYITELCENILERRLNIFWSDCASTINLDKQILKLMKETGCIRLFFGLETASPRMLKYIKKDISLSEFSDKIKFSSKLGIWTGVELIPGLPYETDEDISNTIKFVNKHKNYIDEINMSPFYLEKFSKFFEKSEDFRLNIRKKPDSTQEAQSFVFDEIDGLNWSKKQKQIIHSYRRHTAELLVKRGLYYEDVFIFYLYSLGYNKRTVKKIYDDIYPKVLRKIYLKPSEIMKRFDSIKSIQDLKYNACLLRKFFQKN